MTLSEQRKANKFEKILMSMIADVAYINQQLAIHEFHCIKNNKKFGDEWFDVTRRLKTVLLEVASLA
jgi:hypothetical protein